mgnify:CR=1 FL=1
MGQTTGGNAGNLELIRKIEELENKIKDMEQATRITVTSLCPENYEVGDSSVYIKNGICFAWIYIQCVNPVPMTGKRITFASIPRPERYFTDIVDYNGASNDVAKMGYYMNISGNLDLIGGQAGKYYSLVFSYPVKK